MSKALIYKIYRFRERGARAGEKKKKINRDETPAQAANLQDQRDLAQRSEQEKKEMDFAQQENNNDRDILAFFRRFSLPHRYINSTKNVEKG